MFVQELLFRDIHLCVSIVKAVFLLANKISFVDLEELDEGLFVVHDQISVVEPLRFLVDALGEQLEALQDEGDLLQEFGGCILS